MAILTQTARQVEKLQEIISGTDFGKVVSITGKTCSGGESELRGWKAMVLGSLKIMFSFFQVPGVALRQGWEVCMCIIGHYHLLWKKSCFRSCGRYRVGMHFILRECGV
jgi:hypothetical protein